MRRFLPSTIIFLAVVGVMWLYVTHSTPTDFASQSPFDALNDPEFAALVEREGRARDIVAGLKPGAETASALSPATPSEKHGPDTRRGGTLVSAIGGRLDGLIAWGAQSLNELDDAAAATRSNLLRSPSGRVWTAWAAYSSGKFEAALAIFNEVLSRRPDHPAALAGRAESLVALGRHSEAAADCEKLVKCRPGDTHALYNLGVTLVRLGEAGRAGDMFRAVLRFDPKHARAAFNLATLAQRDGRLSEARTWWHRYTELRPDEATGWFNLGVVHLDFEDAAEAIRCFSYVVIIDPGHPDGYSNLAQAYRAAGDVDAALSALLLAAELSPCDAAIMQPLMELHLAAAAHRPMERKRHLAAASLLRDQLEMESAAPPAPVSLSRHDTEP